MRNITCNARDLAIASTVIAMARKLDLQVIAEGVETQDQARLLLEYGCHVVQGYLYGRPADAQCTDALLRQPHAGPALLTPVLPLQMPAPAGTAVIAWPLRAGRS